MGLGWEVWGPALALAGPPEGSLGAQHLRHGPGLRPASAPALWPGPACSFRFVIASRMLTEHWQASGHTILTVPRGARGGSRRPAAHVLTVEPLAFQSELCLLWWLTQPQEGQRPFLPPKEEMGNFPLLSPESW